MTEYNNQQRPQRKKISLDHPKLHLTALNGIGKKASLQLQIQGNNPRFVVWVNDPTYTENYGKIMAKLDTPAFFGVIQMLEDAIAAPGKFRMKLDNLETTWQNNKPGPARVSSSIIVGKEEDGVIYITVSAPRAPNIKFLFSVHEWHHFINADGSPLSPGDASVKWVQSRIRIWTALLPHLLVTEYEQPKPKEGQGQGGGGGYGGNRQQGGNGGGNGGGSAAVETEISADEVW